MSSLRDALNVASPNNTPDALRKLHLGDLLSVVVSETGGTDVPATTIGAAVVATVGADIGAFTDPPSAAEMALLRTFVNALKADAATVIARVNQARVDILNLRAALVAVGGVTDDNLTVTSNAATLSTPASAVFQVNVTTGTVTGVKKLIPGGQVPITGEVAWDGASTLTFAAADAVTAVDVMYSKANLSQKASVFMADFAG